MQILSLELEANQDVLQWLRLKYALEVSSNYIAWKERMEDNGLKEFIDNDIPKPAVANAQLIDAWQKKVAKERRILVEGF